MAGYLIEYTLLHAKGAGFAVVTFDAELYDLVQTVLERMPLAEGYELYGCRAWIPVSSKGSYNSFFKTFTKLFAEEERSHE